MATDKKISTLVESQLPGYILEEGPNIVAFLKAYYEWMESTGQAIDANKNLLANQDIDTTDLSKFYDFFKREVLQNFPEEILADKRLVAKRIKDLYRAKGSSEAYNLLFRILYNQNVSIYRPSENILRASDGRWTQDTIVRLGAPFTGNFDASIGQIVTGQLSGAKGKISKILTVFESGIEVKQLRLVEVSGSFIDLEKVTTAQGLSGFVVNTIGPLNDVTFGSASAGGGTGHQVGDLVSLTSASGIGARGVVESTTDEVVQFTLIDGGSGYTIGNTTVIVSGGNPKGGLIGQVTITGISNNETIFSYTDAIEGLKDTPIGYGPTYSSNSGIISSNLASSNSSTSLATALGTISILAGKISSISFETGNYADATLPGVFAEDQTISLLDIPDGSGGFKGRNAVIRASFIPGSIADIQVTDGGRLYNAIDSVSVNNLSRNNTVAAVGDPVVSGVINEAGSYKETKGFLSWDQRLQDNYYYQEFSYVLRSQKALKTYRDIVRSVIHPAGTKLFGQVDLNTTADLTGLDIETSIYTDLLGGKDGVPSIEPTTIVSANLEVLPGPVELDVTTSILSATIVNPTTVYLAANGFIYVANNNVIDTYLGLPISEYLDDPVVIGTPFVVQGDGTVTFTTILQGGTQIEIEDLVPGTSGNTTYIVNTVFSDTTFTINTQFTGGSMANGVFRYTYDGNI